MIPVIPNRNVWFILSGLLVAGSLVALLLWGLHLGIDFTGGSLLEISFPSARPAASAGSARADRDVAVPTTQPSVSDVRQMVQTATETTAVTVQPVGQQGMVVRFPHVTQAVHQQIIERLRRLHPAVVEERFDAIGPTVGAELRRKTMWAIGLALVGMVTFISFAFRKVTRPVPSWQYGAIAIVALLHDLLITTGAFALFGRLYGVEINAPFIAALLTVFGYSVNDTIVVFDRIRDNLLHHPHPDFPTLIEASVQQTMVRSTSTSLATLLTLLSILTFGGETIRDFALTLIIGITVGTYSSIFIASPLLVVIHRFRRARR